MMILVAMATKYVILFRHRILSRFSKPDQFRASRGEGAQQ